MRLPEPMERSLEDGPDEFPPNPLDDWASVPRGAAGPRPVVELHYDGIPQWCAGPCGQDVPK
jgi:hypothetical protein